MVIYIFLGELIHIEFINKAEVADKQNQGYQRIKNSVIRFQIYSQIHNHNNRIQSNTQNKSIYKQLYTYMDHSQSQAFMSTYVLTFPIKEITYLYPNLLATIERFPQKQVDKEEKYIKFDYILLPKIVTQQTISQKIIQYQKSLKILCKISKKIKAFQSIADLMFVYDSKIITKKEIIINQKHQKYAQLIQQCESKSRYFIENILSKYSCVLIILKPHQIKNGHTNLNIRQYLQKQRDKIIQCQDEDTPKKYIEIVKSMIDTASQTFLGIFQQANQIAKNDLVFKNMFENNDIDLENKIFYQSSVSNSSIFELQEKIKSQLNSIDLDFFLININLDQDHSDKLQIKIQWNLSDIDRCLYQFKKVHHYLCIIQNSFSGLDQSQKSKSQLNRHTQLKKKIFFFFIKKILSYQRFYEKYFSQVQINWIKYTLLHPTQTQKTIEQIYVMDLQDNQSFNMLQVEKIKQGPVYRELVYELDIQQSRKLLSHFYLKFYCSIFCYIQYQKMWFFSRQLQEKTNFNFVKNKFVRWMPLKITDLKEKQKKRKNKISQKCNNSQQNTYVQYVQETVFSLIEPITSQQKHIIHNHHQFYENKKMKNQNRIIGQQQQSNLNTSLLKQCQFMYNEQLNIIAHQNFSFINIDHFYHFLRNSKNVTRSQFQDKSWTQFVKLERIRLFTKPNKKHCSYVKIKSDQKLEQTSNSNSNSPYSHDTNTQQPKRNLISMPIRGRFCKHLDFFDLWEVYQKIFPSPFSEPNTFQCPKCCADIVFDEIIMLKEFIKIFCLQRIQTLEVDSKSSKYLKTIKKTNIVRSNKPQLEISKKNKQQILMDCQFNILDAKLIVDHISGTVLLKGIYSVCHQSIFLKQSHFQEDLSFAYDTLMNPSKNYQSNQNLFRFINNHGLSQQTVQREQLSKNLEQNSSEQKFFMLSRNEKMQIARNCLSKHFKFYQDLQNRTLSI